MLAIAGNALGKGIELRAIANMTEQFFRLVGSKAAHAHPSLGRPDQSCDQVHERSLARSVRANQAGNAGREREIDPVHSQDFAVELGDILKDNTVVGRGSHPRSTSLARSLRCSSQKQNAHSESTEAHAAQSGTTSKPPAWRLGALMRNKCDQMIAIMCGKLIRLPHWVRKIKSI